tara:strand:+ start:635 stop:994 length:360 start_codon:yes stop_codon:yes gene_type:complete
MPNTYHTMCDIRCGLIQKVQINTCYVCYTYDEGGDLKYIRGSDTMFDEKTHLNNFWTEFSMKYCNMFEKWSKEDHDQELCYLFNDHLHDWKDYFVWVNLDSEEEVSSEEESSDEENKEK